MATRSDIGIVNKNGSVTSIYCHNDGYPSWNGKILKSFYTTEEKVQKLISMGGCSVLAENIEPVDGVQSFDAEKRIENVCVFYHRERGEDLEFKIHDSEKAFAEWCDNRYAYLFKDSVWYYMSVGEHDEFVVLTDEVIENDN